MPKKIKDEFQNKHITTAVWVDLETSYNKVWKKELLKLFKKGISGSMYYVPADLSIL